MKLHTLFSIIVSLVATMGSLAGVASSPLAAQTASFAYAQATLGSGMTQPSGVAVDAVGNLFVADNTGNQVVRIDAATGAQTTVGSGLLNPAGVAVNSAGDVFIADSGNNRVVVVPSGGGPQLTVGASGLQSPIQIAVDAAQNLYIVDNGNGRVLKIWADGSSPTAIATGLANPQGVAVDSAGNVYISENSAETVIELPAVGGSPKTVSSAFIPTQLAVDAAGDLFIAGDGGLMEVPSGGGTPVNPTPGLGGYAQGVAADLHGRIFVTEGGQTTVSELQTSAVDFGTVPLCPASQRSTAACAPTMTLIFNVSSPSQVYPYSVSTQGLGFTEFAYGESTTCGTQTASSICTVAMSFAPRVPGLRRSAVIIGDQHGALLSSVPVYGIGLAPQMTFGGGAQKTVGSGFNQPSGMALDGAGDLFVTDTFNNRVVKITANGGSQTVVGVGLALPAGIAIDGLGNLYVSEVGTGEVVAIPAFGSQFTLASGFSGPAGVAVDAFENVYVANSSGAAVAEIVASTAKLTNVGSGLNGPSAVALDAAGDVFIADSVNGRVVEVGAAGGSQSVVANGFNDPEGIAVDAAGDLFISDTGNNRVVEIPAGGGAQLPIGAGLKSPTGLLLNDAGDLYIADSGNNRVVKVERSSAPALHFASTLLGQTSSDSAQTVIAQNTGNQPMELTEVNYPLDFPVDFDADTLCFGSSSLAPGQACALPVDFTPLHGGALSEKLAITDNSLNVGGTVHSIALSGAGLLAQSIVFLPPSAVTFGATSINLSADAQATSSLPVTFKILSGPAALKGSVLTFTGAGSVVVQASQPGNSGYVAAATVTKTILVAKAKPVIAWTPPASIVYGTKLGSAQLDAKSSVAGKFVYTPAAGTVLAVGTATLAVTFTPSSIANYLTASAKVMITVTKATLTVTAKSFTIKYGAEIPTLTASYSGFVNGDTTKILSGAPLLSTTAKAGSPVGTYSITIKRNTLTAKNYAFKFVDGTLTITSASHAMRHQVVRPLGIEMDRERFLRKLAVGKGT